MLINHVRVGLRSIRRQKADSIINIAGLGVALAGCLLILAYVLSDVSFDQFHERKSQLYRLNWDFSWDGSEGVGPGTPPPLAARLEQDFPEIEAATRVYPVSPMVVRFEDRFFTEDQIRAVDPDFLDLFSFRMTAGNPGEALSSPNSIVLTESSARKYFGDSSPIGRSITVGRESAFLGRTYDPHFMVTGVVEDPPVSSHIRFDFLTSIASHPQVEFFDWSWVWMQVVTYAAVRPEASIPDLEARMVDMVAHYAPDAFERVGFSYEEMIAAGGRWNFVFQPLTDVYLHSAEIGNRLGPVGNHTYLSILGLLAMFIVIVACINFMNLSTARAATRAREIGVRKALGSDRGELVRQFMVEAMLNAAGAMLLAVGLTAVLIKPFGSLAGRALDTGLIAPGWLVAVVVALTALVGLAAGSYPSLYLSRFRPIEILRSQSKPGREGGGLRNALVIFQFAISIALMCCTLVVYGQIRFLQDADLGFDKDDVLVVSNHNDALGQQLETFRDVAAAKAGVVAASVSTGAPPAYGFQDYYKVERHGDSQFDLISYLVDDDFVRALGIEIVAGRGFEKEFSDSASVILNETAVDLFGWDDPLGRTITYPSVGTYTVIGVMKDFNVLSMRQPIRPFALFHRSSHSYGVPESFVVVRIDPSRTDQVLGELKSVWAGMAAGAPFDFSFLDENVDGQYGAERRLGSLFAVFAGLAILIACLGLFGLATFAAERRTKEIGLRKMLGASVAGIAALLARDFVRWVLLANLIAWPIAWYAMDGWLGGFAYRIEIGPDVFVASAAATLLIALGAVGWRTVAVAAANPVDALRYE